MRAPPGARMAFWNPSRACGPPTGIAAQGAGSVVPFEPTPC